MIETELITNKSARIQFLRKVERGDVHNLIEATGVLAAAPEDVVRAYLADEITIDEVKEHNERARIEEQKDMPKINRLEMENLKLKGQREEEQKLSLQQPSKSEIFEPQDDKKGEQQFEPDLEHFRSFGRSEYQNDTPMLYNAKMFMRADPRLGRLDYPGNTSGQIVMNFLYYYTKPDDLVVDPMAGGGTTKDTCNLMGRRCLAYDIHPVRSDIAQYDISIGFPEKAKLCDAIFLDPPYGNIMQEHYSKESISSASIPDFMNFMDKLARDSFLTVKPGGYVAVVMMPIVDEKEGNEDNFTNLPFECTMLFREAGFKEVNDWEIPLAPHVKNGAQVNKAKRMGFLLNLHRRIIIFKKNK